MVACRRCLAATEQGVNGPEILAAARQPEIAGDRDRGIGGALLPYDSARRVGDRQQIFRVGARSSPDEGVGLSCERAIVGWRYGLELRRDFGFYGTTCCAYGDLRAA